MPPQVTCDVQVTILGAVASTTPSRSALRPTPLEAAAELVGDRWTLLVVDGLLDGPRRFGELEALVEGIATNVLSDRLKRLESGGLVMARQYSRRPARFSYELTQSGAELAETLRTLAQWGAEIAGTAGEVAQPRHTTCGSAVETGWRCPTCEEWVGREEIDELHWA
jgi:DNA-binding HxlR family transcriptional regulator